MSNVQAFEAGVPCSMGIVPNFEYREYTACSESSFFNVTFVLDVLLSQLFTRTQDPDCVYMSDLLTWASDNDLDLLVMSGHASDPVTPQVTCVANQMSSSNSAIQSTAYRWSRVLHDEDEAIPPTRSKHACCLHEGCFYLYGGRYGPTVLNDLWKFDVGKATWKQLICSGDKPRLLQEHTMVAYRHQLYVFGGEFACNGYDETPLWILSLDKLKWRKYSTKDSEVITPLSTRGHSAVLYNRGMFIYGGYMDHRGSSEQLWMFDFEIEAWHLASSSHISSDIPEGRHLHSAVVHDGMMWVYGGMSDLQYRGDLWSWNFRMRTWNRVKFKQGPPELKGHTACKVGNHMYIFGGESNGILLHDTWKFNFDTHSWHRIVCPSLYPSPYSQHCALVVPRFLLGYAKNERSPTERVQSVPTLQSKQAHVSKRPATSPPTGSSTSTENGSSHTSVPPLCPSPRLFKNRIKPTDIASIEGTIYDSLEGISHKQKHRVESLLCMPEEKEVWYEEVEMLPVDRQQTDDDAAPLISPDTQKSSIRIKFHDGELSEPKQPSDHPVVLSKTSGNDFTHPSFHQLLGNPMRALPKNVLGVNPTNLLSGDLLAQRLTLSRQYSSTDELISETSLDDMLPLIKGRQVTAFGLSQPGFENPNYRSDSSLMHRGSLSGSSQQIPASSINSDYRTSREHVMQVTKDSDAHPVPLKKKCSLEDLLRQNVDSGHFSGTSLVSTQSVSSSHLYDARYKEQSIYNIEENIPGFVRSTSIDSVLQEIGGVQINYIKIGDDGPHHFSPPRKMQTHVRSEVEPVERTTKSSVSGQSQYRSDADRDGKLACVTPSEIDVAPLSGNIECVTEYETTTLSMSSSFADAPLFDDHSGMSRKSSKPYLNPHLLQKETGFSMFILGGWEPEAIHIQREPLSFWKLDIS